MYGERPDLTEHPAALPATAEAVVVGAGLSGLAAAWELRKAGVEDVLVLDARERVGGRVWPFTAANGRRLEGGGEFVGEHMSSIVGLARELGIELEPLPFEGKMVRVLGGERFVEDEPYASDPEAREAFADATKLLDELAVQVPVEDPWNATNAAELDARTLREWAEQNVPSEAVRAGLAGEFNYCGAGFSELSLLFALWTVHAMGGWETWTMGSTHRLRGGPSGIVERIASELGERVALSAPVRRVGHGDDGAMVVTDRGSVRARVVVAALAPQLCGRIDWQPRLSPARDRLQDRYMLGHGTKICAFYEEPWWRAEGLSGLGSGLSPVSVIFDASPQDGGEGALIGFITFTSALAGEHSEGLATPEGREALFVENATRYLGPRAADTKELYSFSWVGDPWSTGCAAGLPPAVLSTVGSTLREPVGPVVWAGAETGLAQNDWLEGAVSAGQRAGGEAARVLA